MPNQKNQDIVKELSEKAAKAKSIVLANPTGLGVNALNDLRQKMRDAGAEIMVAKNSLLNVALKSKDMEEALSGNTAVVFSYNDALAGIKTLFDFSKKTELPKVKTGLVEGTFADTDKLNELKRFSDKNAMIAQVVAGIKGPLQKFTLAVKAIADKKA